METFAIIKFVLYFIEWIWSLVVFAIVPSNLEGGGLCYFKGGMSTCNYVIAAGVIGWLIIMFLFIGVSIFGLMDKAFVSPKLELGFQVFLVIWWLILAIVVSAENQSVTTTESNTVIAFSWMLVFFCICSAVLAHIGRNKSSSSDMPPPSSMDI